MKKIKQSIINWLIDTFIVKPIFMYLSFSLFLSDYWKTILWVSAISALPIILKQIFSLNWCFVIIYFLLYVIILLIYAVLKGMGMASHIEEQIELDRLERKE